jgi:hypothetical protein
MQMWCEAAQMLRAQAMPSEEIRTILTSADGRTVSRYLELHRERLEERLALERRALAALERALIEAIERRLVA